MRQEYAENPQPDKINVSMKLDMDDSNINMHKQEERPRHLSESMSDHNEDEVEQIGTQRKSVGSQQDLHRNQYTGFENRTNEVTLS